MKENTIELKSVSELNGNSFIVPNYQRGYKWREKDVEYLIEDIAEIALDDNSDYCLQPIVVAKDNDKYVLVDGQQRLTTIWLIINWAKHNGFGTDWNFSIEYKTRDTSNTFLKKIKENEVAHDEKDEMTCDTHYFSQALKAIQGKRDKLEAFFKNLKKNVKIIWYEIDPKEGPTHFERLNSAKISLTNAELVKAFILTKSTPQKQTRMACEWDEMEYKLQEKSFFSFITTKGSKYNKESNRIELLLDLYVGTTKEEKEKDEHHTFNKIAQIEKDGKSVEIIWQEVQNIYNRLLCWYNDNFLYNLIGFLVEKNGDSELSEIWKGCKGKSTIEIKEFVRNRVTQTIPKEEDIRTMVYKDRRTKNVLLLFNVLSLMSVIPNPKPNEYKYVFNDKFHFDLYKDEGWDKEHVHATASESLQSKVEWVKWLKDLDEKLVEKKLVEKKNKLIEANLVDNKDEYLKWIRNAKEVKDSDYPAIKEDKNDTFKPLSKEKFADMFKDIVFALEGEDEKDFKQNSIGNLVLLNANINRSGEYKVAPFSTKRRIIMERVKKGQFVPIGTQNVFMKVYTPIPGHFYKWEKDESYDGNEKPDRDNYIDAMIETINRIK
ncbi:MAG: DUF262 domain-containing protein [Paludibacteraceae bacterium]|nr:DUF262 domain-containing protein [Paludibacteraceae bacterium]